MFCGLCLFENIENKASMYCKTCKDPEPLCKECAKHHIRERGTRDHEICNDLEEICNFKNLTNERYVSGMTI